MNKCIKSLYVAGLIILFTSCREKKDSDEIYQEFRDFDTVKIRVDNEWLDTISFSKGAVTFFERSSNYGLKKIKSTLDGRQYGHFFLFDDIGHLKSYRYLLGDSLHHSLEINKDKRSDKYLEQGTPFVDYMENVSESNKKKYSLMFSVFPWKNLIVSLSTDGQVYKNLELTKSKIMPLLRETDIFCDSTVNKVFLKMEASGLYRELTGIIDSRQFYDTVRFR